MWPELGFASRRAFARDCRDDWNDEARFLGPRELEQALGACADAEVVLSGMGCDEVRAAWTPSGE